MFSEPIEISEMILVHDLHMKQVQEACNDDQLREMLMTSEGLDILEEIGYTGVTQREKKHLPIALSSEYNLDLLISN